MNLNPFIIAEIGINHNGSIEMLKTNRYGKDVTVMLLNFKKEILIILKMN